MHGASRLALPRLRVRVLRRSRSSGRFGLRGGGRRALSEDFWVWGFGFRVWGLGDKGLGRRGLGVKGLGFRVKVVGWRLGALSLEDLLSVFGAVSGNFGGSGS